MAVPGERYESRRLTRTANGYEAERVFLVAATDGITALADATLPSLGDAYPNVPSITVTNLQARPRDKDNFEVAVTYTDLPNIAWKYAPADDVATEVIEQWSFGTRSQTRITDLLDNGIGMRAEGVDVLVPQVTLRLTTWRDWDSWDASIVLSLVGKVNSTTFKGGASGKWLCLGAQIARDTNDLWRVEWEFAYSADGWQYEWWTTEEQTGTWVDGTWTQSDDGTELAEVPIGAVHTSTIYDEIDFNNYVWP